MMPLVGVRLRKHFTYLLLCFPVLAAPAGAQDLHLLPKPATIVSHVCARPFSFERPLRVARNFDRAGAELVNERWTALGVPLLTPSVTPDVEVRLTPAMAPDAYRLRTSSAGRVVISAGGPDGAFYAAVTLAQLPQRTSNGRLELPCVEITDAPALRWRVLSDDVSRGPLPT
ncbi:MAG: glycoside hydrolase family 20 zincin-like fold domain-containing protein, partial [Candidatus Eremiobacteraeota bacterium]|nr:glycoside hydrolase family 20 zincin-like fold domain-containing protein [Candidatus Eremiobacteraeota bacterium]